MEAQAAQIDEGEDAVVEATIQPSTKVQALIETQLKVMEIERCKLDVAAKRRCTIMDRVTFLDKGICILDPKQFMWIQTKQKYDRHVQRMENQKDINEEED